MLPLFTFLVIISYLVLIELSFVINTSEAFLMVDYGPAPLPAVSLQESAVSPDKN